MPKSKEMWISNKEAVNLKVAPLLIGKRGFLYANIRICAKDLQISIKDRRCYYEFIYRVIITGFSYGC